MVFRKNVTNFLEFILKEIFCNLQLHLFLKASIFIAFLTLSFHHKKRIFSGIIQRFSSKLISQQKSCQTVKLLIISTLIGF